MKYTEEQLEKMAEEEAAFRIGMSNKREILISKPVALWMSIFFYVMIGVSILCDMEKGFLYFNAFMAVVCTYHYKHGDEIKKDRLAKLAKYKKEELERLRRENG